MTRTDAIVRLNSHAQAIRALGATALYLFGSTARDEPGARDLDLFIDYDPETKVPSIFRLMQLEDEISERVGMPVTITTRNALHPLMKRDIEREAIRVP